MSHIQTLGSKLKAYRQAMKKSLREVEAATGVFNATLCRIEHGKAVDYETGRKLDTWLDEQGAPRLCPVCAGAGFLFDRKQP